MKPKISALRAIISLLVVATLGLAAYGQKAPIDLARQLLRDENWVAEMARDNGWSISEVVRMLQSQRTDLNGDRVPDYILTGIACGNVNCPVFVYRTEGRRYVRVPLETEATGVPSVERSTSKGYRNIGLHIHGGAEGFSRIIFKYSGSKYRPAECYRYSNGYVDSRGSFQPYKKPRIVERGCG